MVADAFVEPVAQVLMFAWDVYSPDTARSAHVNQAHEANTYVGAFASVAQ